MSSSVHTLFGPYGTRLEQASQEQDFTLEGPTDIINTGAVRETLGSIVGEYLQAGASAVTIPCFGSRQLLHLDGGHRLFRSVLNESFDLVLDQLEQRSSSIRRQLSLLFCVGPMNDCYDPEASPDVQESADFHGQQIAVIKELSRSVRLPLTILFETIPSGREAEGVALALKRQRSKRSSLEALLSYPFTIDGEPLGEEQFPEIFRRVQRVRASSIRGQGLNCGPIEGAEKALRQLSWHGHHVSGVYPNASSRPQTELDQEDVQHGLVDRQATAAFLRYLALQYGLQYIGGCCGYDQEDIEAISRPGPLSPVAPPTDVTRPLRLAS